MPASAHARANAAPSLVLPPAEFTRGRMLSLLVDGQHHEVCLGAPLERAKDWIWSAIEGSAGHANER